jgi:hypothetical protein
MKKFIAKYQRDFEVDIEAEDMAHAEALSKNIVSGFSVGTCKMLSLTEQGVPNIPVAIDIKTKKPV